ncbi:MAG TPA: zinc ribbon domain-containing protein [Dehalococcoidia bacterium]|nr:zinc ribbon domain-containing protein [Dehalococcoidia bacterium]
MVILFGNKDYYDPLGYIIMKCPACRVLGIFSVEQERRKLTLYFVPTFQLSNRQIITCSECRQSFQVEAELKPKIAESIISEKELRSLKRSGKLKELIGGSGKRRGRKAVKSRCPHCENEVGKGMVYCPQCGNKL